MGSGRNWFQVGTKLVTENVKYQKLATAYLEKEYLC